MQVATSVIIRLLEQLSGNSAGGKRLIVKDLPLFKLH